MAPTAQLIETATAALWPLVMVSATAPLIISISNSHANLSMRARQLADERRSPTITQARRESVRHQLQLFRLRIHLSHGAHMLLYLAVLCFVSTVALLGFKPRTASACVCVFFLGTAFLLFAILLQLVQLSVAHRTIERDLAT
jgi:Protein of unknown function (DUF2721)